MPYKDPEARREYGQRYRLANRKRLRAQQNEWRRLNPDKVKAEYERHKAAYVARAKRWQERNPEKACIQKDKWRTDHPEEFRKAVRLWHARNPDKAKTYRETFKPKMPTLKRKWRKANPDKVRAEKLRLKLSGKMHEYGHRRRARIRNTSAEDCSARIKELQHDRICFWCKIELTAKSRCIDHVMPLSRGGGHVPDNLVAACNPCNLSKGAKLPHEWMKEAA